VLRKLINFRFIVVVFNLFSLVFSLRVCTKRWATSIRCRRRRCGMWAAHTRDVRSCTISYDIWPPRYCTLDESAIDIAISCNRYDH